MSRGPRVNLLIHSLPVEGPDYAGDGPNYATISGAAELTDDPNGPFHHEMYRIQMGSATPPPGPGDLTRDRAYRAPPRLSPDL